MKRTKIFIGLLFVLGIFLLVININPQEIIAKTDKVDKAVKEKLKTQPKVRVIVTLTSEDENKKDKKTKEELKENKEKNKQKEEDVLSGLTGNEFEVMFWYDNIAAFSGLVSQEGIKKLEENSYVMQVEDDKIFHQTLDESYYLIDADTAQSTYSIDGSGQAVCVVDSGVDYNHTDLGGGGFPNSKIIGGHDFCSADDVSPNFCSGEDSDPMDSQTHGTHVSGIISSDNVTYPGIASGTNIVAAKVLNSGGSTNGTVLLAGIDWCISNKDSFSSPIVAINISIGDGGEYNVSSSCDSAAIGQGITAAKQAGISVFVASGNDGHGNGINYPACASDAISVGAVYDGAYGNQSWSACGTESTAVDKVACASNSDEILDILAPGARITAPLTGGGQTNKVGTSMATPMAAGAAALMNDENDSLTPEQIRCALKQSPTNPTDAKNGLSHPRIDVDNAIAFDPTITGNTSWTGGYNLYKNISTTPTVVTSGSTILMGEDLQIRDGSDNILAAVDVDCNTNLGTDVSMGQNFSTHKAYIHNLANKANVGNVSLYIPKGGGDNSVWICPGAANESEINAACAGGFALNISNPDNGTYHLVTTDPTYWIVEGIQNTGGFSQQEELSVPQLPQNIIWRIIITIIAVGAAVGIATYFQRKNNSSKKINKSRVKKKK